MRSSFELLKHKAILNILIGDTKFDKYKFSDETEIELSMPYLKASEICQISKQFGLAATYQWGNNHVNLSRWQYMENLLEHCIQRNICGDLLAYFFSKQSFIHMLANRTPAEIDNAYRYAIQIILENINRLLYFSGYELRILGDKFTMRNLNEKIEVKAPSIRKIDRNYIKDMADRASHDIEQGFFDSAITKSRTLLEEVFCYVIERKRENPPQGGDINKLYKKVKDIYEMHGNPDTDRRINTLLSGLEKIVTAVAELRNNESDAHGHGLARQKIKGYHARLLVNSATTMADFILSVANDKN